MNGGDTFHPAKIREIGPARIQRLRIFDAIFAEIASQLDIGDHTVAPVWLAIATTSNMWS